MKSNTSVTSKNYSMLDEAYKFFNRKLFKGTLPDCMILLQRSGKRSMGYFHSEMFFHRMDKKNKVSELSLNPDHFHWQTDKQILDTLVHEMCHAWQFYFGKSPRAGYHDRQWAAKMIEVGLMPSTTGETGGKQTGQQMDDYIIEGGLFEHHCNEFIKTRKLEWNSFVVKKAQSSKRNKQKFTCPECEQNAWAKPDANLICGDCEMIMEAS